MCGAWTTDAKCQADAPCIFCSNGQEQFCSLNCMHMCAVFHKFRFPYVSWQVTVLHTFVARSEKQCISCKFVFDLFLLESSSCRLRVPRCGTWHRVWWRLRHVLGLQINFPGLVFAMLGNKLPSRLYTELRTGLTCSALFSRFR